MRLIGLTLATLCVSATTPGIATALEIESTQVGGFFDDGTVDNSAAFQNFFVGHTSLAGTLFPERRSFFIFDRSGVTDEILFAFSDVVSGTPLVGKPVLSLSFEPMTMAAPEPTTLTLRAAGQIWLRTRPGEDNVPETAPAVRRDADAARFYDTQLPIQQGASKN